MTEIGIHGAGAYIPPLRVSREEIASAHAWVNPGLKSQARSERSAAGWDEDTITMAVEAARGSLAGTDRAAVRALYLGSTTMPFAERLNSGVVASALGLPEDVACQDTTGSTRAGTTALLAAFAAAGNGELALCAAAERRACPAGTVQEMITGHGAAAFLVGPGPGIARLVARASLTVDFVDHFRAEGEEFDYQWEERWVREEGYLKLVPRLAGSLLERSGTDPADIAHFCLPCPVPRVDKAVAKKLGLPEASVADGLAQGCGDTGAAHALLMLARVLETAEPGQKILVVGFGQGGDALLLETTDAIAADRPRAGGVSEWLARRSACAYPRYLALHNLLKVGRGIRAEADKSTALTAAYRHRDFLSGLSGGHCRKCGTYQLPRTRICVNPDCRAVDSQEPHSFAESAGRVVSFTADNLTYTPDPPAYYGLVDFAEGGRLMMDLTNIDGRYLEVGMPVRMAFRVKDHDVTRHYTRYFWKAAPSEPEEAG